MKLHNKGVLQGREIELPEQVIIGDYDAPKYPLENALKGALYLALAYAAYRVLRK